ncbi:MAG: 30S ribosomal protein S16 [Nitrospirae bacterium]|nr:30S ribosomal protein S16 [Nitrospirota bacterium]MBF0519947.1 30S ribosomal protein S16 [Nitrospirota bacterium]MBF0536032.1 30S ribosomal protein S16 [Nitrospirota bacterium]MBF0617920.1 30S ribosomal protein S16 [Nitrospirota bacterium]
MVKIRLTRMGAHKRPFYRIVVTDSKTRRDGRFLEIVGNYDPLKEPSAVTLDVESIKKWLGNGAQPTDIVKKLLQKAGVQLQTA